jgi:hypothetical protein
MTMRPDQHDVISAHPRMPSSRAVWTTAVVLLAAALVAAIVAAVHYRGQASSLERQLRSAHRTAPSAVTPRAPSPPPYRPTVSATSVALLASRPLTGKVTFVAVTSSARQAYVTIMASLGGGRPHTRYALVGGSCSGTSRYRWAAGITNAHGHADLLGPARRVPPGAYWLELSPGIGNLHPSLAGDFTTASGITAYRSGPPMCGP